MNVLNSLFLTGFLILTMGCVQEEKKDFDSAQLNANVSNEKKPIVKYEKLNFSSKNDQISYYIGWKSLEKLSLNLKQFKNLNYKMLYAGYSVKSSSNERSLAYEKTNEFLGKKNEDFNISLKDSGSYYLGKFWRIELNQENDCLKIQDSLNDQIMNRGFIDGLNNKSGLNEDEQRDVYKAYELLIKKCDISKEMLTKGKNFLKQNKKKSGVKTTDSGLQYKVLKMGKGQIPTDSSTVEVNYQINTPDGVAFKSSTDMGESGLIVLNRALKGWQEGLKLMPEGSKFVFYIPQELAFGYSPPCPSPIEKCMPLVCEFELLKIIN